MFATSQLVDKIIRFISALFLLVTVRRELRRLNYTQRIVLLNPIGLKGLRQRVIFIYVGEEQCAQFAVGYITVR